MRYTCAFVLSCGLLWGAEKYVCDKPQDGRPCTYPNRLLQKAFDEAAPGDTLYLQGGFTYTGAFIFRTNATADKPITVTSSRKSWLPGPYSRITPSHIANIPLLKTNRTNEPALSGNLDSQKKPPAHWNFVGIGVSVGTARQFDNSIIHTGGMGVNGWTIQNASELPEGLVFDRVLILQPLDDSLTIQNALRPNGANISIVNSFIWPIFCAGIECHGIGLTTNPGPLTVTNNFLSAGSIPFFTGGSDPDYPGAGVPANVTLRYNYLFRPLKWWSNPGNPDRAYFLKNGSKQSCTKNLLEFKSVDKALIEYNVHENVWGDNYCMGQWFGFTVTPRQSYWPSPGAGGSWGNSTWMDKLTASGKEFSWTGSASVLKVGQNICIEDHTAGALYDCQKIATVDNQAKKGTVATPFTLNANATNKWMWVTDDMPMLRDVTMQNEVFRNVAGGFNILGRDRGTATPGGDEGKIVRLTIRNTLTANTLSALSNSPALRFYPQEVQFTVDALSGARDIIFEHNTFAWKNPAQNVVYFAADNITRIAKIQNLSIRSNIFPDAHAQSDGNVYALGGSGAGFNDWGIAERFAAGKMKITHNQFWSVRGGGCKTADCSKNLSDRFSTAVQFLPNTYKIRPGTPMAKAGHDGTDVGVNYDQLPLIQNLRVTPAEKTAVLEFDLAAPIQDAKDQQPCVLEVSPDENLKSYLGAYTVTNDVNPAYFKQADASSRTNAALPKIEINNRHVRWPLGQDTTVTGDDGEKHSLSYSPGTPYWGRLMCYGDTQPFSFQTTGAATR